MAESYDYDLLIIGAGSGGLTAAPFAAKAGAKVALIERHRIGGDCTWTGCVPSKALLKAAKIAHDARLSAHFGLTATLEPVDLKRVMGYVRTAIDTIYQTETPERLKDEGIDVHMGAASFKDAHTLVIRPPESGPPSNSDSPDTLTAYEVSAKNVLICTGGRAVVPNVSGITDVPYHTNDTIFDLDVLPRHLLVLGGGPIGLELAQAFRRLGSEVTVLQSAGRLLPKDEPEASQLVLQILQGEGVTVHLSTQATAVERHGDAITLHTSAGDLTGDVLLVAAGRRPNVESLDLLGAGVAFSDKGVPVDEHLRTNIKHIYAAGDVIGGPQFTHVAGYQAFVAARNALFPGADKGIVESVPWTTFVDPEVAHVGLTEAEARAAGHAAGTSDEIGVQLWPMAKVDRAVTDGDTHGFIKLIHRKDGTVLGATIVAERAGEIIHEWALAIQNKWKIGALAGVIHVYPTYAIANQQLASAYSVESFINSSAGRVLNRLRGRK